MHQTQQANAKKTKPAPKFRGDIAIIAGQFNEEITAGLLEGAQKYLSEAGVPAKRVRVYEVAGSFEVAELAAWLARSKKFAALVCLGAIIKGETSHDQHLAQAVTTGLLQTAQATGVPIGLGVITANNLAQAKVRAANDRGNRGYAAASAALNLISLK
jgi:6,7-dimethyl-8-ribityllumazine synthase